MIDATVWRTATFALLLGGLSHAWQPTPQPPPAEAVGPSQCVRCHPKEAAWWQTVDGPPPHGHINALAQLETQDAHRYAQRLGVRDVYDTKAGCVTCHATVFRGSAREGVSCEGCHGPASGYLLPHEEVGAYRFAVSAGMADLVGNVNAWAARCLSCHLVTDAALVAAGHSSGKTFDLADKSRVVSRHWTHSYTPVAISTAGRSAAAAMAQAHGR
jgi:Cytochrome c554 and c-prime